MIIFEVHAVEMPQLKKLNKLTPADMTSVKAQFLWEQTAAKKQQKL
jgi:hypothetical protein